MVDLEPLEEQEDIELVLQMLTRARALHRQHASRADLLADWVDASRFVKVMPRDYKRVMHGRRRARGREDRERGVRQRSCVAVAHG